MSSEDKLPLSEDRWTIINDPEEDMPETGKPVVCVVDGYDNYSSPYLMFAELQDADANEFGVEKEWYDLQDERTRVNIVVVAWRYLKEEEKVPCK